MASKGPTMPDNPAEVEITQADRDAAAKLWRECYLSEESAEMFADGDADRSLPIIAFARHRLLGQREGMATVVERLEAIARAANQAAADRKEIADSDNLGIAWDAVAAAQRADLKRRLDLLHSLYPNASPYTNLYAPWLDPPATPSDD